ncbi:hypothetical protein E2C01_002489 [Portunus trituberculatus]|uniref:Uncharacterized protein n=1 Tax=Portunus trituberculatus TaxID=210409 RepID=A0A5B7CM13_PORTR|nr:hypothetical protein [Portunus trituberculatus]
MKEHSNKTTLFGSASECVRVSSQDREIRRASFETHLTFSTNNMNKCDVRMTSYYDVWQQPGKVSEDGAAKKLMIHMANP